MTLRIIQLSDSHISHDYPQRITDLRICIEHINAVQPQPDLVIHTGDVAHDGLTEEYTTAKELMDNLRAPYFLLPGNRDNRRELSAVFTDGKYIQNNQKWIQYSIEHLPVRLLIADTVSDTSNKGRYCQERLNQLEQMLSADVSKPVVLFMHHPPFEATGVPDPFQFEHWEDVAKLSELLSRHGDVRAIYCGHVHRNIDATLAGISASALTCLAGDLRKGEVSDAERGKPVFKTITLP